MDNIFLMQMMAQERFQRYLEEAGQYRQMKAIRDSKAHGVNLMEKIQNMISAAETRLHQARMAHAGRAPQEC